MTSGPDREKTVSVCCGIGCVKDHQWSLGVACTQCSSHSSSRRRAKRAKQPVLLNVLMPPGRAAYRQASTTYQPTRRPAAAADARAVLDGERCW